MADATYQPKVYTKQGAAEYVVASSGAVTVESGGQIDVESGGRIDIEDNGYIAIADGGYISEPVVTDTTAAALETSGVSLVQTTTAKRLYQLGAPTPGVRKIVYATVVGATGYASIASTGNPFEVTGSSTHKYMRITANGGFEAIGRSTSRWFILSKSTGITGQDTH